MFSQDSGSSGTYSATRSCLQLASTRSVGTFSKTLYRKTGCQTHDFNFKFSVRDSTFTPSVNRACGLPLTKSTSITSVGFKPLLVVDVSKFRIAAARSILVYLQAMQYGNQNLVQLNTVQTPLSYASACFRNLTYRIRRVPASARTTAQR